jgi:hypothetical protein
MNVPSSLAHHCRIPPLLIALFHYIYILVECLALFNSNGALAVNKEVQMSLKHVSVEGHPASQLL